MDQNQEDSSNHIAKQVTSTLPVPEANPSPPEEPFSKIYAFGSSECDQFYNDDEIYERKKPIEITFFSLQKNIKVMKIVCGSQHTLVLSEIGKVYSFGNSDDGSLGREITASSSMPGEVKLPIAVDLISAGDTHSVAANSVTGVFYVWGAVKSSLKGKLFKHELPEEKKYYFLQRGIQDLKSGDNHIIILSNRMAYSWGDNDTGALGTVFRGELEEKKIFEPNAIGVKQVRRIFVGKNATFLENNKHQIFACGLNNYGQLGVGPETDDEKWMTPRLVEELQGTHIVDIVGGEHHTILLDDSGKLWGAGRNDDGQLGEFEENEIKEDVIDARLTELQENSPFSLKGSNPNVNSAQLLKVGHFQTFGELPRNHAGQADVQEENKSASVVNNMLVENAGFVSKDDQENVIDSFVEQAETGSIPEYGFRALKGFPIIEKVWASNHFNYAMEIDATNFYSWGFGMSFILGNGKEDSVYQPWKINNEKFWAGKMPTEIALGHAHVVLTKEPLGDIKILHEAVLAAKKRVGKISEVKPNKKSRN